MKTFIKLQKKTRKNKKDYMLVLRKYIKTRKHLSKQ